VRPPTRLHGGPGLAVEGRNFLSPPTAVHFSRT
jgi:hypothetical protein